MTRILLVDDNPAVRRHLRAVLEQQQDWKVTGEARTGAEALHKILESPPDLVVLDYRMPDLNGVDVARQISEILPKVPILMVTLHLSRQLREAAKEAGVRGACAKQDIGSVVEGLRCCCTIKPISRQSLHHKAFNSFPEVRPGQK